MDFETPFLLVGIALKGFRNNQRREKGAENFEHSFPTNLRISELKMAFTAVLTKKSS